MADPATTAAPTNPPSTDDGKQPMVIVVIGMAGTGKTTFVTSLCAHLKRQMKRTYVINLDPAVRSVPFPVNIDIRDTVNYKEVMKEYKLGPNGAIMTGLNLFATRFDQVLELLDKRSAKLDYIIVDTPGQIEVFNWSASGSIILDALSLSFPLCVCYLVDTVRCQRPVTFMSNMMYACSVLYKTRLPFITTFNKIDVVSHDGCIDWMVNYDKFADEVLKEQTYMASLSRSAGLVLNEFYSDLQTTGLSAATGVGFDAFLAEVGKCRKQYYGEYMPWIQHQKTLLTERKEKDAEEQSSKFHADFKGWKDTTAEGKSKKTDMDDCD